MKKENLIKTGYPHIDRPWMQYYDDLSTSMTQQEDQNMLDYLKSQAKNWKHDVAETYYGKEFSYDETLFTYPDLAAKALSSIGVKKGDIIVNMVPNIPESAHLWFGATDIGAISDFIDPRPDSMDKGANAQKVLEIIKYEKPKYIVALDKCYLEMLKPIEHELKDLGIDTIITLGASDSMNLRGKIDYLTDVINYNILKNNRNVGKEIKKLKNYQAVLNKMRAMQEDKTLYKEAVKTSPLHVYSYKDLIKQCEYGSYKKVHDIYLPNYIGHTSGTSGSRPKPIVLTNRNAISTLEQLIEGNVSFDVGDKALHVLPFFAPFGAYDNYLLNLASGANNIDVPELELNEFAYLIKKYHPNVIMVNPAWLNGLIECDYLQNEDLSFVKKVIYGGDALSAEKEEKLNKWLKEHGSNAVIEKGHGMSEFCGCGSYAQKEYNIPDSIGIPLPRTIYAMVDPNVENSLVPIKFKENEERLFGELVVSSDATTEGKLHENIIVPHYEMDGRSYIRTRDLVEMDRNGVFYHMARKDRSFNRFDGYKIIPYQIEKVVEKHPEVKDVRIVAYYDAQKRGNMPICHIVLQDENKTEEEKLRIVNEIVFGQIISNPKMSSRQIPTKFKFRESMPLTKNSKINDIFLEKEVFDGTEFNVEIHETNLKVEGIEIFRNEKGKEFKLVK